MAVYHGFEREQDVIELLIDQKTPGRGSVAPRRYVRFHSWSDWNWSHEVMNYSDCWVVALKQQRSK